MVETPSPDNIEDLSPYVLLQNFSTSRVLPAVLLALLIHVVAIGGTSTGYIYRTWIDPTVGAQQPEAAIADGADATDDGAAEDASDDPAHDETGGPADSGATTDAGNDSTDGAGDDADTKTPPVIQRVTDAANPDDAPPEPGGLGISIDDIKE